MKYNLLLLMLLCIATTVNAQKDYVITIDGKSYDMALDGNQEVKIKGKLYNIGLKKKDTLLLDDAYFEMKYTKDHEVSRVDIDSDIEQIMLMTAGGSGLIIQKYGSFNPTMLQEMMLNEVTKESVSYGYELKREDYEKELSSGETVNILKAVLTYKGETEVYEVMAQGKKDEGIIVMTMNMNMGVKDGGEDMIQLMWNSLKIKA
ncbi:hypothetical protein HNV08_12865 [Winogradskyella eckloniae]|uniref:hypothetical protein n=1 Tax=Winogradskyella eckloniae TaxID=1089306 RepID=UPI001564B904|nr:hypothetical protein [Winogradskyella eckloniae]NRD20941.1 hypothetical protein [Winogradskyella eckloniae]